MSIITPAASHSFVTKARLPKLPVRARNRSGGVADTPPLQLNSNEAQTLVVGSGLVIAAQKVPVATREDLVNCTLFAQLVASAEVGDMTLVNDWYAACFRALSTLGWAQSDSRFEEYDFRSDGAAAHEAVIPVLTALLGPQAAALAVVKATLDGLQSMNRPGSRCSSSSRAASIRRTSRWPLPRPRSVTMACCRSRWPPST